MTYTKSDNHVQEVEEMSAVVASKYVKRMVERESRGFGDLDGAMGRIELRYGIGFWTLSHLRSGRAKSIDANVFQRVRAAYFDYCERQIANIQHEIEVEKAVGDDSNQDLADELEALLAKVKKRR